MLAIGILVTILGMVAGLPQASTITPFSLLSTASSPSSSSSGSGSGSRSGSASAPTYTVPIEFLRAFASTSSLIPSVRRAAASSSAASSSASASARPAAGATFTGAATISGGSAQVTYVARPTAFTAVEGAVVSAANVSLVAAETCIFNSTLTSTVIAPKTSASASGSSVSARPTTVTGYVANCAFNERGRQGSSSIASTVTTPAIAVPASLGTDGYFTWLSTASLRNATTSSRASASSRSSAASSSRSSSRSA